HVNRTILTATVVVAALLLGIGSTYAWAAWLESRESADPIPTEVSQTLPTSPTPTPSGEPEVETVPITLDLETALATAPVLNELTGCGAAWEPRSQSRLGIEVSVGVT